MTKRQVSRNIQFQYKQVFFNQAVIQPFCRSDKVISTFKSRDDFKTFSYFIYSNCLFHLFIYCTYFIYQFVPALLGLAQGQIQEGCSSSILYTLYSMDIFRRSDLAPPPTRWPGQRPNSLSQSLLEKSTKRKVIFSVW